MFQCNQNYEYKSWVTLFAIRLQAHMFKRASLFVCCERRKNWVCKCEQVKGLENNNLHSKSIIKLCMASTNKQTNKYCHNLYIFMASTPNSLGYYMRGEGKQIKYWVLLHARGKMSKPSHVMSSKHREKLRFARLI